VQLIVGIIIVGVVTFGDGITHGISTYGMVT
jgi:hypothetical protein